VGSAVGRTCGGVYARHRSTRRQGRKTESVRSGLHDGFGGNKPGPYAPLDVGLIAIRNSLFAAAFAGSCAVRC
jgi:hypothetical protein